MSVEAVTATDRDIARRASVTAALVVLVVLLLVALVYQRLSRRHDYATVLGRGARLEQRRVERVPWSPRSRVRCWRR